VKKLHTKIQNTEYFLLKILVPENIHIMEVPKSLMTEKGKEDEQTLG